MYIASLIPRPCQHEFHFKHNVWDFNMLPLVIFPVMNFPAVCSEWSEHHSHCTEGAGSGQCSGLGEWKFNALKMSYF